MTTPLRAGACVSFAVLSAWVGNALAFVRRPSVATTMVGGVWLLMVIAAMVCLAAYTHRPGNVEAAPRMWPADSNIPFAGHRPALILLAHPRCPCTRATIGELELLMARAHERLEAHVLFVRPAGTAESWAETDLWRTASAIPGVTVHRDDGGVEMQRFRTAISGETLLYGSDGQLLFHGGITSSRGHAGDNRGRSAILAVLERKSGAEPATPVFGCPLFTPESQKPHDACEK